MGLLQREVVIEFGQEGAVGVRHTGLRVGFQVDMDLEPEPDTARIDIYNLAPSSLSLLRGPLARVRLLVGYSDEVGSPATPRLIFEGNPIAGGVITRKQGPDRITTIEAASGLRAWQQTLVDLVYATPTTASAVVSAIAAQLGLPLGAAIAVGTDIVYTQGGIFTGAARDVLQRLATSTQSRFLLQDGVFFFLPAATPIPGRIATLSAVQGNLIGSPEQKRGGGVVATALLDTSLRPGRRFALESAALSGVYTATAVSFGGESGYEVPFYAVVTGRVAA